MEIKYRKVSYDEFDKFNQNHKVNGFQLNDNEYQYIKNIFKSQKVEFSNKIGYGLGKFFYWIKGGESLNIN
jgi:hypothetical protein